MTLFYYINYFVKIMNEKNSLGLDICFKDEDNPTNLFKEWFKKAETTEPNDPNALSLATADKSGKPKVRMVLLKDFSDDGFTFYTNFNSSKGKDLKENPKASMCFHWKSLLRQIRIYGNVVQVSDKEADDYYNSRAYGSRIGAWASNQSQVLESRKSLDDSIEKFKKKFHDENKVPRPPNWSGWRLVPEEIEFWRDGDNRIHERLKYVKNNEKGWKRFLLNP
jgi:pyridoxamine 5'-phosphate oxidase